MATKPARLPWERQKGESGKAFEAFVVYRDMGPTRSLMKAAQKLDKNRTTIGDWSAKWSWVERVDAWDDEQDRIRRLELAQARVEAVERHWKSAAQVNAAGIFALNKWYKIAKSNPERLRPMEALKLWEHSLRIEREILRLDAGPGEGEEINLDGMSPEEIREALLDMRREIDAQLGEMEE